MELLYCCHLTWTALLCGGLQLLEESDRIGLWIMGVALSLQALTEAARWLLPLVKTQGHSASYSVRCDDGGCNTDGTASWGEEERGEKGHDRYMYFRMQEERRLFKDVIVWLVLGLYVICRNIHYRGGACTHMQRSWNLTQEQIKWTNIHLFWEGLCHKISHQKEFMLEHFTWSLSCNSGTVHSWPLETAAVWWWVEVRQK